MAAFLVADTHFWISGWCNSQVMFFQEKWKIAEREGATGWLYQHPAATNSPPTGPWTVVGDEPAPPPLVFDESEDQLFWKFSVGQNSIHSTLHNFGDFFCYTKRIILIHIHIMGLSQILEPQKAPKCQLMQSLSLLGFDILQYLPYETQPFSKSFLGASRTNHDVGKGNQTKK